MEYIFKDILEFLTTSMKSIISNVLVIAQIIVAFVAVIGIRKTNKSLELTKATVKEMENQKYAQSRPVLRANFPYNYVFRFKDLDDDETNSLSIVKPSIKNVGNGIAKKVTISFEIEENKAINGDDIELIDARGIYKFKINNNDERCFHSPFSYFDELEIIGRNEEVFIREGILDSLDSYILMYIKRCTMDRYMCLESVNLKVRIRFEDIYQNKFFSELLVEFTWSQDNPIVKRNDRGNIVDEFKIISFVKPTISNQTVSETDLNGRK